MNVWLNNIRAISRIKLTQLLNQTKTGENYIICLNETHEKYSSVEIPDQYQYIAKRREISDKKGGGLMILTNRCDSSDDDDKVQEIKVDNPDVLAVNMLVEGTKITIVLVYMDVKDQKRNEKIRKDINAVIQANESEKLMVLGDFNGHLGLVGNQRVDQNGKYLLSLMEKESMILLNNDDRCIGQYTREESGMKSAIDFVLVNSNMYQNFVNMEIDEEKHMFDLSDHCVIQITFLLRNINERRCNEKEIINYFSVKDNMKDGFIDNIERRINRETTSINMEKLEQITYETAEQTLKKKYIKKTTIIDKPDPIWFSKEMKEGIKLRQLYNRKRRNARTDSDIVKYAKMYREQKIKVHEMIKEGINKYEIEITKEIRSKKNSKELWNNINKLRGKKGNKRNVDIYRENGEVMEEEETKQKLTEFWTSIYHKHDNKIEKEWSERKKRDYREDMKEEDTVRVEFDSVVPEEIREAYKMVEGIYKRMGKETDKHLKTSENDVEFMNIPSELIEHYDAVARNLLKENMTIKMKKVNFTRDEIRKQLSKIRGGKKSGPDEMKPEMYKWMSESEICVKVLTDSLNQIIETGIYPQKWKNSSTVLIPKKDKPKHYELRPLAMTNVSYKLFMSLIKEKITDHLLKNKAFSVYQAGFTKNRRIEDNIFILRYCIADSKRRKKPLYIAAVDFAKAFDSIKREHIVRALKRYKCDPQIIDILSALYMEDKTDILFNGKHMGTVKVKSGIRQGCTGSPLLFIMVLNYIIEKIAESKLGFRNENLYIPVLFFADDGLLICESQKQLGKMIKILVAAADEVGLQINREKSNILIFNEKNKPNEIEKIGVTSEIKYLGVTINDKINCFKEYKSYKLKSAQRLSNLTFSVIARSCNKILIGKTYWKSVVLPSLLYGLGVVTWTRSELEHLQRMENSVWRCILGAPGYTPVTAMRGDIGASAMVTRDMKTKLKYIRYALNSGNQMLRTVMEEMLYMKTDSYVKKIEEYIQEIGIASIERLLELTDVQVDKLIRDYDKGIWLREMEQKKTLELYSSFKTEIKEENYYDNTEGSVLMFRARSNTLKLRWRNRFEDGDVCCLLCGEEEETLSHFIKRCRALREVRERYSVAEGEMEEIMMFSGESDAEECKAYILEAWKRRARMMKEVES